MCLVWAVINLWLYFRFFVLFLFLFPSCYRSSVNKRFILYYYVFAKICILPNVGLICSLYCACLRKAGSCMAEEWICLSSVSFIKSSSTDSVDCIGGVALQQQRQHQREGSKSFGHQSSTDETVDRNPEQYNKHCCIQLHAYRGSIDLGVSHIYIIVIWLRIRN